MYMYMCSCVLLTNAERGSVRIEDSLKCSDQGEECESKTRSAEGLLALFLLHSLRAGLPGVPQRGHPVGAYRSPDIYFRYRNAMK